MSRGKKDAPGMERLPDKDPEFLQRWCYSGESKKRPNSVAQLPRADSHRAEEASGPISPDSLQRVQEIQCQNKLSILPNDDFEYVWEQGKTKRRDKYSIKEFTTETLERHSYTTNEEYIKKEENMEGIKHTLHDELDIQYRKLLDVFPNADPAYLWEKCKEIAGDEDAVKEFIRSTALGNNSYPTNRKNVKPQEKREEVDRALDEKLQFQYLNLLRVLPNVDPELLWKECRIMGGDDNLRKEFIISKALEDCGYPTYSENGKPQEKVEQHDRALIKKMQAQAQYERLLGILPTADSEYLWKQCQRMGDDEDAMKEFISEALNHNSNPIIRKCVKPQEKIEDESQDLHEKIQIQYQKLVHVFPNTDCVYLWNECKRMVGDEDEMEEFISESLDHNINPKNRKWVKPEEKIETDAQDLREKIQIQYQNLVHIFPNTDREYLWKECKRIAGDEDAIKKFIRSILLVDRSFQPYEDRVKTQEEIEAVVLALNEELQVQYHKLLGILPNADPEYLWKQCKKLVADEDAMSEFISEALQQHNYPKHTEYADPKDMIEGIERHLYEKLQAQFQRLLSILPNADPEYLWKQCKSMLGDEDKINEFVSEALEHHSYPKHAEYVKPQDKIDGIERSLYEKIQVKYQRLLQLFPTVDPGHLWKQCKKSADDENSMNEFISQGLKHNSKSAHTKYRKTREKVKGYDRQLEERTQAQYQRLVEIFPNADREYLWAESKRMAGDEDAMNKFISEASKHNSETTNETYVKPKEKVGEFDRALDEKIEIQYQRLSDILPNADPEYLRDQCKRMAEDEDALNEFVLEALKHNSETTHESYVKPKENVDEFGRALDEKIEIQYQKLLDILPNADPQYLWKQCKRMAGDEDTMEKFVSQALKLHNYPTNVKYGMPQDKTEGIERAMNEKFDIKYQKLLKLFPNADHEYLWLQCKTKAGDEYAMKEFIAEAAEHQNYPKHAGCVVPEDDTGGLGRNLRDKIGLQYQYLLQTLPNAEPEYLLQQCKEIAGNDNALKDYLRDAFDKRKYPTMEHFSKHHKAVALQIKFLEPFSVEEFLKIFDDPWKYFLEEKTCSEETAPLGMQYLGRRYDYLLAEDIETCYMKNNYSLARTCRELDQAHNRKPERREGILQGLTDMDILFIQEVAFIENEAIIKKYRSDKQFEKDVTFVRAKRAGELMRCHCCQDDEVLLDDMASCNKGHLFCKACINRRVQALLGETKTTFPCLERACSEQFSLRVVQEVLEPRVFSSLLKRKQLEKMKPEDIAEFESCPFCDFTTLISSVDDKVFHCLNPECVKDSCRRCKELNHEPLRCREPEKPTQVRTPVCVEEQRTEPQDRRCKELKHQPLRSREPKKPAQVRTPVCVEEQRTEPQDRKCWKCQRENAKKGGFNKMMCICGASMCYYCRQPIEGYEHFQDDPCPLFSNDQDVHLEAQRARQQAMELKYDSARSRP